MAPAVAMLLRSAHTTTAFCATAPRLLSTMAAPVPAAASRFLSYVNASPTPFHAVAQSVEQLEAAGFTRLRETEAWSGKIRAGGKYFYTRNQSALIAFAVGHHFRPGNGVHVVGAHTDSPNFHIKPVSRRTKDGYLQCGVEAYGGGLWSTWFDRDLGVAGRVIVADSDANSSFTARLVHIRAPLLRIPNLAVHLNRGAGDNMTFNKEDNTVPILGLVSSELNQAAPAAPGAAMAQEAAAGAASGAAVGTPTMGAKHHPVLLGLLAAELGVDVSAIQDFELSLYDTQPATVGGVDNAFIFSPRLDNQMSCFCATEALVASVADPAALAASGSIRAICLFDNEEVGSVSTHGAESNLLVATVQRLASVRVAGGPVLDAAAYTAAESPYEASIARSFLLSSDMAHAFHPNYSGKYEDNHRPRLNAGPVVKTNANQRYASTGPTTFLLRRVARAAGVPLQEFEVRNDMPCGSTIGPMLSKTGIRTVDIGNPQLAMHSIREMCGSKDPEYKIRLFHAFFDHFERIDQELVVD